MQPEAKIILDSISPNGNRLTTIELNFHRFVLAEFNTHRSHSRNSASSRAIPVEKQLGSVLEYPAFPLIWSAEQAGMQGGGELVGRDLWDAQDLFTEIHYHTTMSIQNYLNSHPEKSTRLHKSLLNRLLEPFMWHRVIATATKMGWENFFKLRSSYSTTLAQPEIMAPADIAYDVYGVSIPTLVGYGDYHTPYIRDDDDFSSFDDPLLARKLTSIGRCARVSYLTHDGRRDIQEDINLANRLWEAIPRHDSPFEHVATPTSSRTLGNFQGWEQVRHGG